MIPLTPQPHTATYLSRISLFILRAPHSTLTAAFDPHSNCPISSLTITQPSPSPATNQTCQTLLRILHDPNARASPATIPYALCLLLRFRDASDALPIPFAPPHLLITIAVYISFKILRDGGDAPGRPNQYSDKVLMCFGVDALRHWCWHVGVKKRELEDLERNFLEVLQFRVWVRNEEYARLEARMRGLWEEVLRFGGKSTLPVGWKGMGRQI
ncbi:hypothetical protein P153DRAFT_364887 [Dothidotthia symphoricarpi CBS 119687]|uniref:Uncharacterized protein n=1 Tax=Dothidotthia symphoricarpi CBS 119687 TaxID=1392245 RepID=A0A6A6AK45_9PLEO|nr:uncharacterized protein P153DRAFT_364887 [Dothidotthia symphoricarpi CBS 119687]KAF2131284.1 hypothetical protein P153DRAFT_364887 [Dothidotthia symphoricarpi CBS 119687]